MINKKSEIKNLVPYFIILNFILNTAICMNSNNTDSTSEMTLERAVFENNIEWVSQNIQKQTDKMLSPGEKNYTPIDLSVMLKKTEILKLFVQNNLKAVFKKSPCGSTPLEISEELQIEEITLYLKNIKKNHELAKKKIKMIMEHGNYHGSTSRVIDSKNKKRKREDKEI